MIREFKERNGNIVKYDDTLYEDTNLTFYRILRYIGPQNKRPVIPSGVRSCERMFENCTALKEAPEIPSGVTYCSEMFKNCTSLTVAPEIPKGVINCSCMFSGCTSLTQAPVIPDSVIDCEGIFEGCTSLNSSTPKEPVVSCELSLNTVMKLLSLAAERGITAKELQEYISNYKSCITSNMDAYNLPPDEQALAVFDLYF